MTDPKLTPVAYIIERAAAAWGVPVDDLLDIRDGGGNYLRGVPPQVECRHIAMLLALELTSDSIAGIGRKFRRDPSTAFSNIGKAKELVRRSLIVRTKYEALLAELGPVVRRTGNPPKGSKYRQSSLASTPEKDQKERATETALIPIAQQ